MATLEEMATQYGLTLETDGHNLSDADGAKSYLNYSVYHVAKADYINRKAEVHIELGITVRRMGGEGLTIEELERLERKLHQARMMLADLQYHPIEYSEKW
jgi:hypothetical protein